MPSSVAVAVNSATHVAEARRVALDLVRDAGLAREACSNCSLVVTELGTNLLQHAQGGTLVFRLLADSALEVLSLDNGPGIRDTDRCFMDGYSTGSSLGTGLGAVRRLSFARAIYSVPGQGTAVMARVGVASQTPGPGVVSVPYPGESVCGDSWCVERDRNHIQVTVADGLGHGPLAEQASVRALAVAQEHAFVSPDQIINLMHPALRDTRGVAVSIALCHQSDNSLHYSGVGNIAGSIWDARSSHRLATMNGTAGLVIPRVQLFTYDWEDGGLLVMHSDGISAKWSLDRYPGLQSADPALVAGVLFRDHRRMHDDATVVALRLTSS